MTPNASEDNIANNSKKQESFDSARLEQEPNEANDQNSRNTEAPYLTTECIEEQPILPKQHLTFEEMLENQL